MSGTDPLQPLANPTHNFFEFSINTHVNELKKSGGADVKFFRSTVT